MWTLLRLPTNKAKGRPIHCTTELAFQSKLELMCHTRLNDVNIINNTSIIIITIINNIIVIDIIINFTIIIIIIIIIIIKIIINFIKFL